MHDPLRMLFHIRLLRLDIWHREPDGHDAGDVCGPPPDSGPRAWWWYLRHVRHWHPRWHPVYRLRRWVTVRCDECGRRFRWRDSYHSYMSTDKVWHDECMSLRHVRSQLDDLAKYVLGTADSNTRWRANYRLRQLEKNAKETTDVR